MIIMIKNNLLLHGKNTYKVTSKTLQYYNNNVGHIYYVHYSSHLVYNKCYNHHYLNPSLHIIQKY